MSKFFPDLSEYTLGMYWKIPQFFIEILKQTNKKGTRKLRQSNHV